MNKICMAATERARPLYSCLLVDAFAVIVPSFLPWLFKTCFQTFWPALQTSSCTSYIETNASRRSYKQLFSPYCSVLAGARLVYSMIAWWLLLGRTTRSSVRMHTRIWMGQQEEGNPTSVRSTATDETTSSYSQTRIRIWTVPMWSDESNELLFPPGSMMK